MKYPLAEVATLKLTKPLIEYDEEESQILYEIIDSFKKIKRASIKAERAAARKLRSHGGN